VHTRRASGSSVRHLLNAHPLYRYLSFTSSATMLAAARSSAISAAGRRSASTLALKYSKAVFNAALSKSPQALGKVQTELTSISTAIKDTPEINAFVTNPTLSAQDRQAGLQTLLSKAEGAKKEPVSDVTKNLFSLLADNGRLVETQGIIEGFNEMVAKHKGELTVTVTSASPLPKDVQTKLEAALKQSQAAQQAKTLKIQNKVQN
jgi:F-type H+-transporting ATPase subunit O